MDIPDILNECLKESMSLIDLNGDFPFFQRMKLLQLIEDVSKSEHVNAGYLRRSRLELICAIKVRGNASMYLEVDLLAKEMLKAALSVLSGEGDIKALEKSNNIFHSRIVDLLEYGEDAFLAVYAAMACFSAVNTVLYDIELCCERGGEEEIPPDDWNACFYGSLAASGSAVWEGKGGEKEREAYWRWYLERAVVDAWDIKKVLIIE